VGADSIMDRLYTPLEKPYNSFRVPIHARGGVVGHDRRARAEVDEEPCACKLASACGYQQAINVSTRVPTKAYCVTCA
jgi:hypothetical protein